MSYRKTRSAEARLAAAKRRLTWVPTPEVAWREIRRTRRRLYRLHRRRVLVFIIIFALLVGGVVFYFGFDLVTLRGAGMNPTLAGGDMVLCVKQSLLNRLIGIIPDDFQTIRRNDVVLVKYTPPSEEEDTTGDAENAEEKEPEQSLMLIRRVIGVGGDAIDAGGGELILNQSELVGQTGNSDLVYPVNVPPGQLFLMGDQSAVAIDSRLRAFGLVNVDDVVGRPLAVVWPLSSIGLVS